MENTEKIEKWMQAFDDDCFQTILQDKRNKIETILVKCIHDYKQNNPNILVFDSLESRIKSHDSFVQKLSRKDYVNSWVLKESNEENQTYIMKELPDLIGFRVSCHFNEDEKRIYDYFLNTRIDNITLNENTNTVQENGHTIYKIDGCYNNSCNFEIQIKSLVNNFWGEVEHKTIYKGRAYDCNNDSREILTEDAYKILTATDSQLNSLFKLDYDKDKMIKELFYEFTHNDILSQFNTNILGKAYSQFFSIYYSSMKNDIISYVANSLLDQVKKPVPCDEKYKNEYVESIKSRVLADFIQYDFSLIKAISGKIVSYSCDNDFYSLLFNLLTPSHSDTFGDEPDFSDDNEDYDEQEEPDTSAPFEETVAVILARLKDLKFRKAKLS